MYSRRRFLSASLAAAAAGPALAADVGDPKGDKSLIVKDDKKPLFEISLAGWSLHLAIFGGKLSNLDFPVVAKKEYGIDAVEYVNQFWMDKARDQSYLKELKGRADDNGVKSVLIMCDREGYLGDADEKKRAEAVENHIKWLEAAKFLGCHSIRVNAYSTGSREEQEKLAADGLHRLCEKAKPLGLNVIVENHGGLSSDGSWLSAVMKRVGLPNCGTLPDFGNFKLSEGKEYDRYQGVDEMMPFAKGVSAKTHDFDAEGNEIHTDYMKMMEIVIKKHGYRGRVGIEYEGQKLTEPEGIKASKVLLEKIREKLSA